MDGLQYEQEKLKELIDKSNRMRKDANNSSICEASRQIILEYIRGPLFIQIKDAERRVELCKRIEYDII